MRDRCPLGAPPPRTTIRSPPLSPSPAGCVRTQQHRRHTRVFRWVGAGRQRRTPANVVLPRAGSAVHVPARGHQGAQARHLWTIPRRPPPRIHGIHLVHGRAPYGPCLSWIVGSGEWRDGWVAREGGDGRVGPVCWEPFSWSGEEVYCGGRGVAERVRRTMGCVVEDYRCAAVSRDLVKPRKVR